MDHSLRETVAEAVASLSLPPPASFIQTMLMKDGFFVGWKFRYDGGHALLHVNDNTLELFDQQGTMVKTVTIETKQEAA